MIAPKRRSNASYLSTVFHGKQCYTINLDGRKRLKGHDLHELYKYVCIQINDTHPSMVIPELINRLVLEGIDLHEAIDIVSKTCAYTNHTILAEALEKWHLEDLKQVVPQLIPTIQEI